MADNGIATVESVFKSHVFADSSAHVRAHERPDVLPNVIAHNAITIVESVAFAYIESFQNAHLRADMRPNL